MINFLKGINLKVLGKILFFVVFFLITFGIIYNIGNNKNSNELNIINDKPNVYLLGTTTCPHCQDAKNFLSEQNKKGLLNYKFLDVTNEGKEIFEKIVNIQGYSSSVPIIFIDGGYIKQGYSNDDIDGKEIVNFIKNNKNILSFENYLEKGEKVESENRYIMKTWFLGEIDIRNFALGTIASIIGFIDGFNPCAMWVLVMFLTILVNLGDRKKMLQFVSIFLVAEAIMYYLILNVWMFTWNFIGIKTYANIIVALISLGAGIYFLYDWKTNDGTCKVGSLEQKSKTSKKIQEIAKKPMTIGLIFSILLLAFSVNIFEFVCSFGMPQTFTKIISDADISLFMKQIYNLVYILFYMIDDLIVFGIAIYSFDKIGITTKYSKIAHLIGGIIMIILGSIFLIAPNLLSL